MKRLVQYIPTVLVVIGITYVSLLREPSFSLPRFTGADKVAHFIMYAALSLVFLFDSWRANSRSFRGKSFYIAYGGLIEILQENFFYPRTGTWGDWFADIAGCAVGLLLYLIIWSIEKRK